MKADSLAILNSNDRMPTNADGVMPFRQNNDLLYLCGIDQEETILLLYPGVPEREILFLKETNEQIAIWEGNKLNKEQASRISGIAEIYWLSEFDKIYHELMAEAKTIYLNRNEHAKAETMVETRDDRYAKWCKQQYPNHSYEHAAPLFHQLRATKSEEEIRMLREACNITKKGFRRVLGLVRPGISEYEIEAEFAYEFLRNKSRGFAYEPIIASGFNACVLHYIENNAICQDGETVLMDVGAEYGNYNADMTRCIPVNGRFTKRQKDVYNAVLRVKNAAQDILKPGVLLAEYQKHIGSIMEKELIDLQLIDKTDIKNQTPDRPAYKKYFMHGTSHHLGLDVHDVGDTKRKVETGMVFTVEPGIYIREENLGIRLEDNIVIRESGFDNLMADIPIEIEEIEDLMYHG